MAVTAAAIGAIAVTLATVSPPHLPEIALHSKVLFHLERTAALVGATLALIVAITRAWAGELPAELSTHGLRYNEAAAAAVDELGTELSAMQSAVSELSARVNRIEEPA
jgi:hypothetical protein